jgi:hypothetical protein
MKKTLKYLGFVVVASSLLIILVLTSKSVYASEGPNCAFNQNITGYYTFSTYTCHPWGGTAWEADDCLSDPNRSCTGTGCLPKNLNKDCDGKTYAQN